MKLFRKTLIVAIFTILFFILTKDNVYAVTGTITTETLKLRKSPSTDSAVLDLMSVGEDVDVIEKEGEWYKIKYNGTEGYAHQDYIKVDGKVEEVSNTEETPVEQEKPNQNEEEKPQENKPEETPEKTTEENNTTEQTDDLKEGKITEDTSLKILPLINSENLKEIKKDSPVIVMRKAGKWAYISIDGINGWIIESKIQYEDIKEQNNEGTKTEEPDQNNKDEKPVEEKPSYESKKAFVNSESINVRESGSMDSEVITTLKMNAEVTITGEEGDWYKIEFDGKTGYVAKRLLSDEKTEVSSRGDNEREEGQTSTKTMYVNVSVANVRNEATTSSSVLLQLQKNDSVIVLDEIDGFYKVQIGEKIGYISNELLGDSKQEEINTEENNNPNDNQEENTKAPSDKGEEVVALAKKYLGYKYVYGGASPSSGFDCSGYTQYIFKQFGVSLSHSATAQSKVGSNVSKSDLKLGDIVIFNDDANSSIGHVGIYIGENNFIHASNPSDGVKVTSLSNSYYLKRYVTARRLV